MDRRLTIIGTSLVVAGAVVTAIGVIVDPETSRTVLAVLGAGLASAGLIVVLRTARLRHDRAGLVGGVLIATGAVVTVIGASIDDAAVEVGLPPVGGALFVAGLVELVLGVRGDRAR